MFVLSITADVYLKLARVGVREQNRCDTHKEVGLEAVASKAIWEGALPRYNISSSCVDGGRLQPPNYAYHGSSFQLQGMLPTSAQ